MGPDGNVLQGGVGRGTAMVLGSRTRHLIANREAASISSFLVHRTRWHWCWNTLAALAIDLKVESRVDGDTWRPVILESREILIGAAGRSDACPRCFVRDTVCFIPCHQEPCVLEPCTRTIWPEDWDGHREDGQELRGGAIILDSDAVGTRLLAQMVVAAVVRHSFEYAF